MSRSARAFTLIELLVVIAIIALLVSILLPALASARRSGREVVCRSNLHQLGVAQHAYISDFKEYLPTFTGRAEDRPKNGGPFPRPSHCESQALYIVQQHTGRDDLKKFISGVGDVSGTYRNVPMIFEQHSHLMLIDYLDGKVLQPLLACPEDAARRSWQLNELTMTTAPYKPEKPTNTPNIHWFPYGSSYQLMPATWTRLNVRYNVLIYNNVWQGTDHDNYTVTSTADHEKTAIDTYGGQRYFEISFPAGKVSVADSQQRHHGRQNLYYGFPEAKQPLLFWDSSVSLRVTGDANRGWNAQTPIDLNAVSFAQYKPDPGFEPKADPSRRTISPMFYRWTRAGLKGIDYGGKEPDIAR